MARTKKCDECRKDCIRENMIHVDYMTRNGNIRTKTYCSEECSKAEATRKQLIENTNNLLEVILEMPIRTNMYFNKLYSPIVKHYGYKAINEMLHSEYSYICDALNKDFVTPNVKIKYFMAIVQNKIEDYKNTTQIIQTIESKEEDVYEIKNREKKKRKNKKSIFDI